MNPFLLAQLMFVHFAADFVFQSNWMATNKSKNELALVVHCLVYSATFIVFGNISFCYFLCITHWATDFVTSRITSKLFKGWYQDQFAVYAPPELIHDRPTLHNFFVVIGFDQLIHFLILLVGVSIFNIK